MHKDKVLLVKDSKMFGSIDRGVSLHSKPYNTLRHVTDNNWQDSLAGIGTFLFPMKNLKSQKCAIPANTINHSLCHCEMGR